MYASHKKQLLSKMWAMLKYEREKKSSHTRNPTLRKQVKHHSTNIAHQEKKNALTDNLVNFLYNFIETKL